MKTRNNNELLWFGIDLDDTIAKGVWPDPGIGEPMNLDKLWAVIDAGYKPVIYTARPWSDYEAIEVWLKENNLPVTKIICGKPLFKRIIDDKAYNAEEKSWVSF